MLNKCELNAYTYKNNSKLMQDIETGFKLFDGPKPCVTNSCVSSADSKIPKRAPGTKLPLWPGDSSF